MHLLTKYTKVKSNSSK